MIKINIHIEADSVEEARSAFAQLGSAPVESLTGNAPISGETSSPAPVEKPKTRGSKTASAEPAKQEATVVQMATADPMSTATAAPTADPLATIAPVAAPAADPLASAPTPVAAPVADPLAPAPSTTPLAASDPVADPLASAPAQAAPVAPKPSALTIQDIRNKIGTLGDKKQQCKDLIATYKKADGSPCEKPSDLQESDYESVYNDLDYI